MTSFFIFIYLILDALGNIIISILKWDLFKKQRAIKKTVIE